MASRTPPAPLIDQKMAEGVLMHLSGTDQAAHTATAAATQHCEHAEIIRTVAYSGVFLIYDLFMTVAFLKKDNKIVRPMTMQARRCP